MKLGVIAGTIAAAAALASLAFFSPEGGGATWDDPSDAGHSMLVDELARDHNVRVVESSLALLPDEAGDGDVLFLFPTHRPAAQAEVDQVRNFVADGGRLVMAADGQNAAPWAHALGIKYQGLPAILAPGHESTCIPTTVPTDTGAFSVCLPSPTTFPNLTRVADGHIEFSHISLSDVPVFLDTDQDKELSIGDQGPVTSPVALQWSFGLGHVIAIADADLWRNSFLRSEDGGGNLALAGALADDAETVYVDSSGRQDGYASRVLNPGYRVLSAPGLWGGVAFVAVLASVALGTATAPRAKPLLPHDPPEDAVDHDVEQAAMAYLARLSNKT